MGSTQIIFTQVVKRPDRKLFVFRGKRATHYFEFCEEVGCHAWEKLLSIKGALYEPVGMWMPDRFRPAGTSYYTQGVEVPADYNGKIPEGMEVIDLPACQYLFFQSQPYPQEKMNDVIEMVQKAMEQYDLKFYGWQWADDAGPRIQLAPLAERGYIEARPVQAL
jgi:uncharacterized protein (DUF3820 family)